MSVNKVVSNLKGFPIKCVAGAQRLSWGKRAGGEELGLVLGGEAGFS